MTAGVHCGAWRRGGLAACGAGAAAGIADNRIPERGIVGKWAEHPWYFSPRAERTGLFRGAQRRDFVSVGRNAI
jgi:hypothetical protein